MQNMMLRLRNVKIHSRRSMKRFFTYGIMAYTSRNRAVFDFALHSGDPATTDRSGSVNQISTNVDQNFAVYLRPLQGREVFGHGPQPMMGRRRPLVFQ
jgi:hypothetical protein